MLGPFFVIFSPYLIMYIIPGPSESGESAESAEWKSSLNPDAVILPSDVKQSAILLLKLSV